MCQLMVVERRDEVKKGKKEEEGAEVEDRDVNGNVNDNVNGNEYVQGEEEVKAEVGNE